MTDMVGIAGDRIRSFIERIEHIDEEIKALNEGKKEAFSEAKGEGFDVKVLKEILRLRKGCVLAVIPPAAMIVRRQAATMASGSTQKCVSNR